jgi:hypothetical protein
VVAGSTLNCALKGARLFRQAEQVSNPFGVNWALHISSERMIVLAEHEARHI